MIYISSEQVIELHDALVKKFGGLPGLRERGLLESALAAPMMAVFGRELHETVYDKASAYLFYIARNHPFLDGNKRTATSTALLFLRSNNEDPKYDVDELVEFVVTVAEGKRDIPAISRYVKKLCS